MFKKVVNKIIETKRMLNKTKKLSKMVSLVERKPKLFIESYNYIDNSVKSALTEDAMISAYTKYKEESNVFLAESIINGTVTEGMLRYFSILSVIRYITLYIKELRPDLFEIITSDNRVVKIIEKYQY